MTEKKENANTEKQQREEPKKDKRLENLVPFEKGQSGNPAGRPRGSKNKITILREMLEASDLQADDPLRYYTQKYIDIIESTTIRPELKVQALENLFNRVMGKPTTRVEHGRTPEELAFTGAMVLATLKQGVVKDRISESLKEVDVEDTEFFEK